MAVYDQHDQYKRSLRIWEQVRDCVEGESAIKARMGMGEGLLTQPGGRYLPPANPGDISSQNLANYQAYRMRASYVNYTGHTKEGMLGMVFRKPMEIELPEAIEYLEDNATGGGLTLEQLVNDITGDSIEIGRFGILVDFPESEEGLTREQTADLQASLLPYPAETILNWRTEVIGGKSMLSLVVLEETIEEVSTDGFTSEMHPQYRVLRLVDGVYTQQVYDKDGTGSEEVTPTKADGSTWNEIPFIIIGSLNNDETVDKAPLYDLSCINLAHYRNSADFEDASHMTGQPTPVFTGLNQSWVDDVLKDGVQIGSRSAVLLPEGANAALLQANANQMPMEGMKQKETQMVKVGARLIQDTTGNETAEAARIRYAGQNSKLGLIVSNIESALRTALSWAGEFMGSGESESELTLNREFYDKSLDAQQVIAMIQLADRGDITQDDIRDSLRRAGWINKTDDELDDELEQRGFDLELANRDLDQEENNQSQSVVEPPIVRLPPGEGAAPGGFQPIINIEFPQDFVQVTVEAPNVTVNNPEQSLAVNMPTPNRDIKLVYDQDGVAVGAESRAVVSED